MDGYHAGIRKTSHATLGKGKPTDLTNHRFLWSMFVNCEWCGCMIVALVSASLALGVPESKLVSFHEDMVIPRHSIMPQLIGLHTSFSPGIMD